MEQCPKCGYKEPLDQSIYWQRNPRYAGLKLGKSKTSMQLFSCYLMCWSYVTGRDPLEVNQLFIDKGVYKDTDNIPDFNFYDDDIIDSAKACEALGLKYVGKFKDINRMPTQELSIKEVSLGKSQHFTVRILKDGKRSIFDPWVGKILPVNTYPFRSYRVFDMV